MFNGMPVIYDRLLFPPGFCRVVHVSRRGSLRGGYEIWAHDKVALEEACAWELRTKELGRHPNNPAWVIPEDP